MIGLGYCSQLIENSFFNFNYFPYLQYLDSNYIFTKL